MSEAPKSSKFDGIDFKQIVTWIIAITCAGLSGSVVGIWWTNRSSVVQYTVTHTVLGTNQSTVVPNFKIQVGDVVLESLYLFTLKIKHESGPEIENATVGIEIKPSVKFVGNTPPCQYR